MFSFFIQIRKCKRSVDDCWFCALFPKRLDQDLEWLPDPTTGPDGEFLLLSDCIGTETTDDKRPSLDGKIAISENDKKNKSHLNAAQVRGFIICQECGKRRAIYCKRKLSHIEVCCFNHLYKALND
ncbi:uncharacterized protein LOC132729629 [Ruditapes philippinarum]|uniref:uncharacterized protein LOC132729629 n=1 Tax=Ruditapes philippinarum TaxID=129788 RepID=UPI00295AD35E|nr:uncharacterized protein LOC132729629 [Ruditapes philippinarum]